MAQKVLKILGSFFFIIIIFDIFLPWYHMAPPDHNGLLVSDNRQ
jgi:hypothetical protein